MRLRDVLRPDTELAYAAVPHDAGPLRAISIAEFRVVPGVTPPVVQGHGLVLVWRPVPFRERLARWWRGRGPTDGAAAQ